MAAAAAAELIQPLWTETLAMAESQKQQLTLFMQQVYSTKEALLDVYKIDNASAQSVYWAIYRRKIVLSGPTPVERLTVPELLQAGECARVSKPDSSLPWKRYIAFASEPSRLAAELTAEELDRITTIWVEEIASVVVDQTIEEDGTTSINVNTWPLWMAMKTMEPAAKQINQKQQEFMDEVNSMAQKQALVYDQFLQQMLDTQQDLLNVYKVDNASNQSVYWAIYRKKIVLSGEAPVERLTVPELLQAGECARVSKPDSSLPWKRYIAFASEPSRLAAELTAEELDRITTIWVEEIASVVVDQTIEEDGTTSINVNTWPLWMAMKTMEPAAKQINQKQQEFMDEMRMSMLQGMVPHAYAKSVAHLRNSTDLCTDELLFNVARSRVVRAGIEKLTGLDCSALPANDLPRIQICGSGGGYRAMVATLGSLIGMEETGLLDCVTTMSGLSGSTWAMSAWLQHDRSLTETRQMLSEKLPLDFYTNKLWPDTIVAHIKERVGFDQEVGLVDVMAWHLHHHLLKDCPSKAEHWNHPRLSEQAAKIVDGSKPMPIYTAVTHEQRRFRWFEFTPFEVGVAQDINSYIPTWSFGRHFHRGVSTDFAIQPSLALLQATWGSAFCATVDQMFSEIETKEGEQPALQKLLHTLIYDKLDIAEDRLFTPAKFPNFTLAVEEKPLQHMKALKLMDAGVHTNLPFMPLLRPERQTDIIIAFDQSSAPDIYASISLDIMEKFAKEEGMPFPSCADALEALPASTERMKYTRAHERRCTIIKGDMEKGIPTIIYLPLLRNDAYSKDFCPRLNGLTGGYCSTFNFSYTSQQVKELAGLTQANVRDARDEIVACIKEVTAQRIEFNKKRGARPYTRTASTIPTTPPVPTPPADIGSTPSLH